MAYIALKIDVDTLKGTQEGVPTLLKSLERAQAGATFLFSLGPDHTGWALRRIFRPGFLKKVSRTSVLEHYGLRTLLNGVLWPGPDIGRLAKAPMQAARNAGFECGIHTWDHIYWQDNVREQDRQWTIAQMDQSYARFLDIFGTPPSTHGAAGWQMNETAFLQIDAWGLPYASDGRGTSPYRPTLDGRPLAHIQLPTTLPTFDEILGVDGANPQQVVQTLLAYTDPSSKDKSVCDHVFTLHAELEGRKLNAAFVELLAGWRAQGHTLVSLADYYATLTLDSVPEAPIAWGCIPGRSGELIIQ